jgi:Zn-dependent protease
MLFTLQELLDVLIMTAGVSFIFMDRFALTHVVKEAVEDTIDPLIAYYQRRGGFDWENFWIACLITAPAVIFHELAHKLVAMSYGLQATFHAAYFWLSFGIIMKLLNTGFIFFVPGYVSFSGAPTPLESATIAFAGPFLNFVLWFSCWILLKYPLMKLSHRTMQILAATRYINGFLFVFNMIPFGFFDGAHVLEGLIRLFAG